MALGPLSRWLFALLALAELRRCLAQPGKCLEQTFDNATDCVVFHACNGISCEFGSLNQSRKATVSVEKCKDPAVITLTLFGADDDVPFTHDFTSSGSVIMGNVTSTLYTSRNASYVDVQVSNDGSVVIPLVSFPINQSECMCESMGKITSNVDSPVEDTVCVTNAACTGMECTISIDQDTVLVLESELEFCQLPPGMLVVLRMDDGTPIFEHYFVGSSSELFTIPPDIPVNLFVSVVPGNYSVTIVAQIEVSNNHYFYDFIPEQQIIVDTSRCVTEAPPLTDTPPPSNQPITQETCDALVGIATSTFLTKLGVSCSVTSLPCDGLLCDVFGYWLYMEVLPCEQPPVFFLQVNDSYGVVYENKLGVGSTSVPLGDIGTLVFTVTEKPGAVTLKVSLITGFFLGQPVVVVRQTDIPIDQCQCPSITSCAPEEVTTLAPPTPGPVVNATCDEINDFVRSSTACRKSAVGCDAFVCNTFIGYQVYVQILPCHDPPAFRVTVNDTINSESDPVVIFDDVLTDYTAVPLPDQGDSLHIMITTGDESLSIMVVVNYSVPNIIAPVVPLTQIPFDTCVCPDKACPQSSTPTPVPSSTTSTSSNSILLIVVSIVAALIVVVVLFVVVVAFLAIHKRRKRTDGYAFRRMTFINAEGMDEQDDEDADEQDDIDRQNYSETGEESKKTPQ